MKGKIIRRLVKLFRPQIPMMFLSFLLAVLSVVCSLSIPVFIGEAVDLIISENNVDFNGIPKYAFIIVIFALLSAALQWSSAVVSGKATARTMKKLRIMLFDSILKAEISFIDNTPHGKLKNTITNDIEVISDGLCATITQLFTGITTVIGTLFFMLNVSVPTAIVVVVLTPLSILVASVIAKGSHKFFSEQSKIQGEMNNYISETLANKESVLATGYSACAVEKYKAINKRLEHCGFRAQIYSAMANPSTRFVNALVYASAGVVGGICAISGNGMTIGSISTFLIYASQYTKPFNEISAVSTQLQSAMASAERVFEILDCPREKIIEKEMPDKCAGEVVFDNISFSYTKDKPLIDGLNLKIKSGSHVAIVGKTGSGKTTLINLLMGFYYPQSGRILIDGVDSATVSKSSLRSHFGMVLQDTSIFTGTIKDNIAYGKPDASDEEIKNAAKLANADRFITRMPQGYNTVIGNGTSLSHGQRQLICIARAIISNPEIAILDEATSGIDVRTERKVQSAFANLMRGRTSFVVAHRLNTIKNSDIIIVMDDGKIAESGTHEVLMSMNGLYSRMYNALEKSS